MQKEKKVNSGFTLVELIIVIAIMAILAGIIGLSIISYIDRARKNNVLNEAKAVYDQINYAVASFDQRDFQGNTVALVDGLDKTDANYGQCGQITSLTCYNVCGAIAGNTTFATDNASFVEEFVAKEVIDGLTTFSQNDYANISPNGKSTSQITIGNGKFCFAAAYNSDGCLYVEIYHKGYFVHYTNDTSLDDIVKVKGGSAETFSNVQ